MDTSDSLSTLLNGSVGALIAEIEEHSPCPGVWNDTFRDWVRGRLEVGFADIVEETLLDMTEFVRLFGATLDEIEVERERERREGI